MKGIHPIGAMVAMVMGRRLVPWFEGQCRRTRDIVCTIPTKLMVICRILIKQKQEILETADFQLRAEILIAFIESQLDVMDIDKKVRNRVKGQMEKSQREYYLNEQIKAAQKELGDINDEVDELSQLESDITKAGMSKEALKKANNEFSKFKQMSPMSAEAAVIRSYLDCLIDVPWKKRSKVKSDLKTAIDILNEDHFGLDEVKERILEYLAVQQRVKKLKAPVICLVGPPGVGKTSLGQSIARATNRKFARMSLGGVRDESEIRGIDAPTLDQCQEKLFKNSRR